MEHGNIKLSLCIQGYTLLGWLFFFTVLPLFGLYSCLTGRHRKGLKERLGFYRSPTRKGEPRIWLHAASVGEARATYRLLKAIRKRIPEATYFVTTATVQGKEVAQQLVGKTVPVFLAPLDFPFAVSHAIKSLRPDIFVNLETELWPQLLHRLYGAGARIFLANGRISARSLARYRPFGAFMRYLLGLFQEISVIGQDDAERYIALGADPEHLHVTGNIKLDSDDTRSGDEQLTALRSDLGLTGKEKIFICGSTRTGEEELLLPVYLQLKNILPDLLWFIAPRHLERLAEVEELLRNREIGWQRLSVCRNKGRTAEVVVIDTMGDLKLLYGLGTYIFCGGSLVAKGGHNIMEPIMWGKPVFYGPSMADFIDTKKLLEGHGIGFEVASADQLLDKILELESRPDLYNAICRRALNLVHLHGNVAGQQAEIIFRSYRKGFELDTQQGFTVSKQNLSNRGQATSPKQDTQP